LWAAANVKDLAHSLLLIIQFLNVYTSMKRLALNVSKVDGESESLHAVSEGGVQKMLPFGALRGFGTDCGLIVMGV
jgi:hypothetical protein